MLKPLLRAEQLPLQPLGIGDIRIDFQDADYLAGFVPDRSGGDHDGHLLTVPDDHAALALQTPSGLKRLLDGTVGALRRSPPEHFEAGAAARVTERPLEGVIAPHDVHIAVDDGNERRQRIEKFCERQVGPVRQLLAI
jgi:hypothetical protein